MMWITMVTPMTITKMSTKISTKMKDWSTTMVKMECCMLWNQSHMDIMVLPQMLSMTPMTLYCTVITLTKIWVIPLGYQTHME